MVRLGGGDDGRSTGLTVVAERGSGRAYLLIAEAGRYGELAREMCGRCSDEQRTIVIEIQAPIGKAWRELSDALRDLLEERQIRQASFVAFGAAGAVVQNFALARIRAVRSLVIVNGAARPDPSPRTRIIDWLEAALPLGLPFRQQRGGFNGKPFLHRLRCPVLVITLPGVSPQVIRQRGELLENLPTAWSAVLPEGEIMAELWKAISEFQNVRVKCSQKGELQ